MLRLDRLCCGYGGFQAVRNLSLQVAEASIFALVGANGAGKSSTLMAIAGHVEIQAGGIMYRGQDIGDLSPMDRVRAGIAVVPEGRRLFPDLSVAEHLLIGGYRLPVRSSARRRDAVLALFPRLAERLEQRAGSLSGGEQQMLAIGRALMAEPRLLLIDEMSLGLMPKMVDTCYAAITSLRRDGMTILLVEQNTDRVLQVADRICVLESGTSVWRGSAQEARDEPELIDLYLGMKPGAQARRGADV